MFAYNSPCYCFSNLHVSYGCNHTEQANIHPPSKFKYVCTAHCTLSHVDIHCDRLLVHSHRRTVLTAPLYGVSQGVLLLGYIVAFRFGIYQVTLPEDPLLYTSFADMFKIFTALVFVCINIGMSTSLAPDYAKAKVSAKRIFSLLDRKPKPDAYSEHGVKLVSYQAQILNHNPVCKSEISLLVLNSPTGRFPW